MSVALFHTADYHIGAYRWVHDYLGRTQSFLDELADFILEYEADEKILTIVGDFWDSENITERERVLGTRFLTRLLGAGVHIVETLGNHEFVDAQGLTMLHDQAHWSCVLSNYHVVAGSPQVVTVSLSSGPYQFFCLPCTQNRDTADLIREIALLRNEAGPKAGHRYVLLHEAVSSSRTFRGEEIRTSKTLSVPEDPDIDGYLLGDIHLRQQLGARTWYCGSPLQIKRDENPDSGLLVWQGSDVTYHPLTRAPKFVFTQSKAAIAESVAAGDSDILIYVGSDSLDAVAALPKNVIVDPNYAAIDVSDKVGVIVSSECRTEAVEQLPSFLAELGHGAEEQEEGVLLVLSVIDKLGIS